MCLILHMQDYTRKLFLCCILMDILKYINRKKENLLFYILESMETSSCAIIDIDTDIN